MTLYLIHGKEREKMVRIGCRDNRMMVKAKSRGNGEGERKDKKAGSLDVVTKLDFSNGGYCWPL